MNYFTFLSFYLTESNNVLLTPYQREGERGEVGTRESQLCLPCISTRCRHHRRHVLVCERCASPLFFFPFASGSPPTTSFRERLWVLGCCCCCCCCAYVHSAVTYCSGVPRHWLFFFNGVLPFAVDLNTTLKLRCFFYPFLLLLLLLYIYIYIFLLATATNTHTHTHTEYSIPSTIASSLLPKLIAVSSIPLLITLALFRVAERSAMPAFTAKLALLLVAFALLASYASADCAISGCINCALSNPNMCLVCDDGFHLTSIGSCLEEGNGAHGPQSMAVAALVLLLGMLMYVL